MNIFKKRLDVEQQKEILEVINDLILEEAKRIRDYDLDSEEYKEGISNIDKLTKIRQNYKKEAYISRQINADTILRIVAGTALTLAILAFEKEDIINTKSFGIGTRMVGL